VKQQIIVSGIGGQGVLFLTRVLAEAALEKKFEVLTSETHGMAMRGGTVISHIKVGDFRSPLIRRGQADIGLFLHADNWAVHGDYMKPAAGVFINASAPGDHRRIDATGLAQKGGSLVVANLVLLGCALTEGSLFCDAAAVEAVIRRISPPRRFETNMKGLRSGLKENLKKNL
jgi:indolepyruvate ferredoxin oxidoreductase beta subunit